MSGGGSSGSQSNTFSPPDYTKDAWTDVVNQAQGLTSQPQNIYQGPTVAPINGQQTQGINFLQDRALYGAPDLNAGRAAATDIASGAYQSNPWLDSGVTDNAIQANADNMSRSAAAGTMAQTDGAFSRAGAFGGSAYQNAQAANQGQLANQVGTMAANYRQGLQGLGAQDYRAGVGNMLSAGSLGGTLSQDDWKAGNTLTGIGDALQQQTQNVMNANQATWQNQQDYPYSQLQRLSGILGNASGVAQLSNTQTQQGQRVSPLTGLLGLGTVAAGAYTSPGS